MKTPRFRFLSTIAVCTLCGTLPFVSGCGGSNASSTATAPSRSEESKDVQKGGGKTATESGNRLGVFVTSAPGDKYGHVWANIQKIELLDTQEKWVTVFESVDGATLDLSTLSGTDGNRFHLLTAASVPAGRAYVRAKVTFGKAFQVFDPGANVGKTLLIEESVSKDSQERPSITFPLERPRDFGSGQENLLLEFDLAKFETKEDKILPFVREGASTVLPELSRQEPATFTGTISEMITKDDGTTFTLTIDGGRTISVRATEATAFYNDGPTPSPKLENGKQAAISGVLSPENKVLIATQVKVYGETKPSGETVSLRGIISNVNPQVGTMAVVVTQVHGITPTLNAVTVTVAPDAVLRSSGGLLLKAEDFYSMLGAGRNALATFEGTYEPVTGAMKAVRVKLEEAVPGGGHEAEVLGTPKDVQADAGTLTVDSLTQWDGIAARGEGKGVPILTTAATAFRDDKGQFLASNSFFTGAASGERSVRVTGIYSAGSLTATRIDLLPPAPKPEGAKAEPLTVGPAPEPAKAETTRQGAEKTPPVTKPESGEKSEGTEKPAPTVPEKPTGT